MYVAEAEAEAVAAGIESRGLEAGLSCNTACSSIVSNPRPWAYPYLGVSIPCLFALLLGESSLLSGRRYHLVDDSASASSSCPCSNFGTGAGEGEGGGAGWRRFESGALALGLRLGALDGYGCDLALVVVDGPERLRGERVDRGGRVIEPRAGDWE